jgi:hypothetical protein
MGQATDHGPGPFVKKKQRKNVIKLNGYAPTTPFWNSEIVQLEKFASGFFHPIQTM